MQVQLITMSQDMDLAEGSITNFIVLKLPSGTLIKALISDVSANQIVKEKYADHSTIGTDVDLSSSKDASATSSIENDTFVFGGSPQISNVSARPIAQNEYGYPITQSSVDDAEDEIGQM